jgi:hypothetical protein
MPGPTLNEFVTKLMGLARTLEQKGVWINRDYADQLLTVFVIIGDEVKVGEITALTDKPEKGLEWKAEFPRALATCLQQLQPKK